MQAKVLWFTGLPASGKTTLALQLKEYYESRGLRVYVIDGDDLRSGLNADLTFTDADRSENIRRTIELVKILLSLDIMVIVATISPFKKDRLLAKKQIGSKLFVEIYLSTPLIICEKRDPKSLYRSARMGYVQNVTGIDSPYEVPNKPNIEIDTTAKTIKDCIALLVKSIA